MSYIVIPIFSDPFLHPLHKDNGLSLLYVKKLDGKSQMICQFHPDCVGVLEDFTWLENEVILFGIGTNISAGFGAIIFSFIEDFIGSKKVIIFSLIILTLFGLGILYLYYEVIGFFLYF